MIAPAGAKRYLCSHGYTRKGNSRRNRGRRRVGSERTAWPDESRRARSFGVRIWRRIPIVFITAQGDEKIRMQALRAGAVKFMTKPLDHGALLDSVRTALSI